MLKFSLSLRSDSVFVTSLEKLFCHFGEIYLLYCLAKCPVRRDLVTVSTVTIW